MKANNKAELRIEEILTDKSSLRHDGKPLSNNT
jgi:hypothetical protein